MSDADLRTAKCRRILMNVVLRLTLILRTYFLNVSLFAEQTVDLFLERESVC